MKTREKAMKEKTKIIKIEYRKKYWNQCNPKPFLWWRLMKLKKKSCLVYEEKKKNINY